MDPRHRIVLGVCLAIRECQETALRRDTRDSVKYLSRNALR